MPCCHTRKGWRGNGDKTAVRSIEDGVPGHGVVSADIETRIPFYCLPASPLSRWRAHHTGGAGTSPGFYYGHNMDITRAQGIHALKEYLAGKCTANVTGYY